MDHCILLPSYGSQNFFENCLLVAIRSIQITNPLIPIVIFHNNLSDQNKDKLVGCQLIEVDINTFNVNHRPDLTEGTYFKFYIEKLTDFKRVLCLDADIVVLGDLKPLFEIEAPIAARTRRLPLSHEYSNWEIIDNHETISNGDPILQGGVLCLNPQFWAKEKLFDQLLEITRKYRWSNFRNADQGILNIIAHRYNNYFEFGKEYNFCRYWDMLKNNTLVVQENNTGLKLPYQNGQLLKILHWNGKIKPHEFDINGFEDELKTRLLFDCYQQFNTLLNE